MNFDQLLASARLGDRHAVGKLLAEYWNFLIHQANQRLAAGHRVDFGASDVAQNVNVQVQLEIDGFQGNSEVEFRAWLGVIARNAFLKMARERDAQKRGGGVGKQSLNGSNAPQPVDAKLSPSGDAVRKEQLVRLHVAMQLLTDDHRRVIELRSLERLPFSEIGERMSRSADASEKLWCRAIRELREVMGKQS